MNNNRVSFSDVKKAGKLCGTPKSVNLNFYSLHESLRVVFVSDDTQMDYDGFKATYKQLNYSPPICPKEAIPLSGNGKISSTNYPKSNYTASRNCTWNITAPANETVKFVFTDFVLSECLANNCSDSCSYVELYDGGSTSSSSPRRFCQGSSWKEPQFSTGSQLFVMFHPGPTVARGFVAEYSVSSLTTTSPPETETKPTRETTTTGVASLTLVTSDPCTPPGESINASSGHISSPSFPNSYDANKICTWNITVPSWKIIKLTFLNFTLVENENTDCSGAASASARVLITNVASHGGDPNDFKLCGQKLPYPVYSEGNFIQVRFDSRSGPVKKGFNASFEAIDGNSLCPTEMILNETSGSLSSPFHPRNYPFNQTCSWKIIAKQGYRVELTIPDYNLHQCDAACSCDYLEVQNSFSDDAPAGKLCGTPRNVNLTFYSIHESLRVVFVSDDTKMDYDGFKATYKLLNYSPPT